MSVVKALVLRPIVREKLRTILTLLGISVGVAVIVAIELSNQSALRTFRESIDAVAGRANYQIVSDAEMDETLLIKLQPLWDRGVRFAPVIDLEGVVEPSQIPIRLLAVDLLSDIHFRDYRYASVTTRDRSLGTYVDLFRHDSVIVPAGFAREHHLRLGSELTLSVLGNRRTMIVRGILEPKGPATAFNGSIAIADIATAQSSFGLAGKLSRIDVIADDSLVPAIRKLLPAGLRIERPSRRNERVENMLRAFRVNLFALGGVALLVGMFLVYNTVLISILRRRKDVGVFKTLGVSPRQIFGAFAGEGLVFGLIGSLLGIAMGDALAYGILRLIGRTINSLYVSSHPEAVRLTPGIIVAGVLVGTLLSLISAIQPSLEAARVRPNLLIRPGLQQRIRSDRARQLATWSIAFFVAAAIAARMPPVHGLPVAGYIAVLFVVGGFSMLAPMTLTITAAASRRVMRRLFGVIGEMAAASLPQSLRRTAVAAAALALATGMMVAVALMVGSFRETVQIWVDQTIRSDLWVRPSREVTNAQVGLFPPQILDDMKRFPFIEAVDPVRGRNVTYGDSLIFVGSGDFAVAVSKGLPMVRPRSAWEAFVDAKRTGGVMVSESFSLKFGKDVGDEIELPTARGISRFRISGIYRDYSNDRGVVVIDRPRYIREYDDASINNVVVFLKPGASLEAARATLERELGPKYHAFTISNAELRRAVLRVFDQTFLITYALLAVAIVVAVLGIVNTLAALILERRSELALLRVLGVSAGELRTMLVLESGLLGLASLVAGVAMGYVVSWILINVINKQSFGWTIEFHTPVRLIALSLAVTFVSAVLAGLVPSRLAGSIELSQALKTE